MLEGKKANIKIGGDFDPIPMDKYTVQIADVNWKTQMNRFKGEEEEKLNFKFVILDKKPCYDDVDVEMKSTRGRFLWHAMTQSMSPKSWLLRFAKALYGRELTNEEMQEFDPESVIGKQVDVMVEQQPSKDGTTIYNNIVSYAKTSKPLAPLEATREGQPVVEKTTKSVSQTIATVPNLQPSLDDPFNGEEKTGEDTMPDVDLAELDAELEKMEKLKAQKLKAAKATKK